MLRRCVMVVTSFVFFLASSAWAETSTSVRLSYSVPADECPAEEAFQDAVRTRLGTNPFADHGFEVNVRITKEGENFTGRLSLVISENRPALERQIQSEGEGCGPLVEALAMTLSVLIDPTSGLLPTLGSEREIPDEPETTPEPELVVQDSPPPDRQQEDQENPPRVEGQSEEQRPDAEGGEVRSISLLPRVGFLFGLGRGPGLTVGPVAGFGVLLGRFSLSFHGRADFTIADFLLENEHEIEVVVITGGLSACFSVSFLDVCLKADVGGLQAQPPGGEVETQLIGFVGAELGFEFPFNRVIIRPFLGLEFSVVRTEVYLEDIQAWVTPLLAGFLGLELKFDIPLTDSGTSSHVPDEPL